MKRVFSKRQRKILKIIGGNVCQLCDSPLESTFHADHRVAFSKGGKTIIRNGQALCATCNLQKGDKDV